MIHFRNSDLSEIGVPPSGSIFNPNLVFDAYAIVRIPGALKPIPVAFEARSYQYRRWPIAPAEYINSINVSKNPAPNIISIEIC